MRPRTAAASLAALAWMALLFQLFLTLRTSIGNGKGIANGMAVYLAYFTVLTNLLIAVVATIAAGRIDGGLDLRWRGCAVTAIVLVGTGYHFLLSKSVDLDGPDRAADLLLHYATPLTALAWWIAFPPRNRIAAAAPLSWLAWPALYAVYALLRGAMSSFYPYPFIDASTLGYTRVMANIAGLALAFLVVAFLLRGWANRRVRA